MSNCILCGSPGESLYEGLDDVLFGAPGTWSFKRCANSRCQLIWLDPQPLEEDIGKAYATYYTHQDSAGGPDRARVERQCFDHSRSQLCPLEQTSHVLAIEEMKVAWRFQASPVAPVVPVAPARAVGRGDHDCSLWIENAPALGEHALRIMDMLDHMGDRDGVELLLLERGRLQRPLVDVEASRLGPRRGDWVCFDACDCPA